MKYLSFFAIHFVASVLLGALFKGVSGALIMAVFFIIVATILVKLAPYFILKIHSVKALDSSLSKTILITVEKIAHRLQIPMPTVYLIPDHLPNAFSVGRDKFHSSLVLSQGLVEALTPLESEAIITYELVKIKNNMNSLPTLSSLITILLLGKNKSIENLYLQGDLGPKKIESKKTTPFFNLLSGVILFPFSIFLINRTINTKNILKADKISGQILGSPFMLASALRKIQNNMLNFVPVKFYPMAGHLYTVNPFCGSSFYHMMKTHPTTEERIANLLT